MNLVKNARNFLVSTAFAATGLVACSKGGGNGPDPIPTPPAPPAKTTLNLKADAQKVLFIPVGINTMGVNQAIVEVMEPGKTKATSVGFDIAGGSAANASIWFETADALTTKTQIYANETFASQTAFIIAQNNIMHIKWDSGDELVANVTDQTVIAAGMGTEAEANQLKVISTAIQKTRMMYDQYNDMYPSIDGKQPARVNAYIKSPK